MSDPSVRVFPGATLYRGDALQVLPTLHDVDGARIEAASVGRREAATDRQAAARTLELDASGQAGLL